MSFIESHYNNTQKEIRNRIEVRYPAFFTIITTASSYTEFVAELKKWLENKLASHKNSNFNIKSKEAAYVRLLVLLENEGAEFADPSRNNQKFISHTFYWLWQAVREDKVYATSDFFDDISDLLERAFSDKVNNEITDDQLLKKMQELPKGTDEKIVKRREDNKIRVIKGLIPIIENTKSPHKIYHFTSEITPAEKLATVIKWWDDYRFHLRFAIRTVEQLQQTTDYKLPKSIIQNFELGVEKGIPIFINPYYLSLIHVNDDGTFCKSDRTIRDYVFNSKDLVDTFGEIKAWEKEDIIEEGKPNAAGWLLPNGDSVHRRYPEVAIFIPQGRGRACAGLCVSCQRMYGFQKGQLNFNMDEKEPKIDRTERQRSILDYFETDSHLQDVLITGGDAFMNTDEGLRNILDDFYEMAKRKKEKSESQDDKSKIAIFQRVRLGTRILAYLPQRVGDEIIETLKAFKQKASKIGVKQFIIQTHFQTSMEMTPEAIKTIKMLRETGWLIVNQQVFTAAASRRSHNMQLRRELNKTGILPYYTFAVKGYKENRENFAPIARLSQEVFEEKALGKPKNDRSNEFYNDVKNNHRLFRQIEEQEKLPFVATDRSLMNLPALGKSLSFEQIGITIDGRRVLSFEHDKFRNHSPVVNHKERVIIVESKSISKYLRQLESMGESIEDYQGIYAYSTGETERRSEVFEYPKFSFAQTKSYNHCDV